MSEIVADFVVATNSAASEALSKHHIRLISQSGLSHLEGIATALDHGYDADLDEITSPTQPVGFDHIATSQVFRDRLSGFQHLRSSHHIWEADEERGIFSLFGRPSDDPSRPFAPRRTRASAIVQRLMKESRHYRQAEKATTKTEPTKMVTIPSPLYISALLLADPRSAASQTYATVALQEWLREEVQLANGGKLELGFASISEALNLINNRWKTSKTIISDIQSNGATVIFLCNLFAIYGLMAMRCDLSALVGPSRHIDTDRRVIAASSERERDLYFTDLLLGRRHRAGEAEFMVNPQYANLPTAGAVLNLIDSLPLPMEGASTVFQGGIRLTADKSIVAAVSGQFGAGKTLFGLSLAASLAPLGCRTLFLSCEESRQDLQSRLVEATPRALFRSVPLFRALDEEDFKLKRFEIENSANAESRDLAVSWFMARHLSLAQVSESEESADPAAGLAKLLEDTIKNADIFQIYYKETPGSKLPRFARPVVIVDGLHQLFDFSGGHPSIEPSLRKLIDKCRELGAVFIFSFSSEAKELKQLEYLCDLIIELDRGKYDNPAETPRRIFQLLKARRQPARTGAHIFHLKGDAGFRIKPSLGARVEESKDKLWQVPDDHAEIFLTDEPPVGFRSASSSASPGDSFAIRNQSQILVLGQGSSGKAGFGLYLLHRRWFDRRMFADDDQLHLPMDGGKIEGPERTASARKRAIIQSSLPYRFDSPYLETRVLVISFLYQSGYYDELTLRLSRRRRGKADRRKTKYDRLDRMGSFEYAPIPDKVRTDTIQLYPGMLSVEDFIAKVEKALSRAEGLGVPYTGVLVDGLHNVFVQFPSLENESSFWGVFYNVLRRRNVTVVTTHTEFEIQTDAMTPDASELPYRHRSLIYDFEQAQRKIAPLLSALVSGADYLFNLSPSRSSQRLTYKLTPLTAIGSNVDRLGYIWNKDGLRLDSLPSMIEQPKQIVRKKEGQTGPVVADQLVDLIARIARNLS